MAKTSTKEPTKAPSDEKINRRLIYGRRQGHRLHKKQARLVADLLPQVSPDLTASARRRLGSASHFPSYALEIGFGGGEHLARARRKIPIAALSAASRLSMVWPNY